METHRAKCKLKHWSSSRIIRSQLQGEKVEKTVGNLQAKAVLDTLANTLAELEGETLGDTLGDLQAEARVNTVADTVSDIEAETISATLRDVRATTGNITILTALQR